MVRRLFEESHQEIVSLLQAGKEEFDRGNQCAGLSILLEAQCALTDAFQREMEKIDSRNLESLFRLQCILAE
jgi:hypothetical protein